MQSERAVPKWRRARSWVWLAAAAGLAVALLPALDAPARPLAAVRDTAQLAAALLAATLCWIVARDATGRVAHGWRLLGSACGVYGSGLAAVAMLDWAGLPASPSPADMGLLAFYPLALAGLLLLSPLANSRGLVRTAVIVDGILATLAAFVVAWPLVLDHAFETASNPTAAWLTVAYPTLDILLLGLAGGILMRKRAAWRSSLGLAYAGLWGLLLADLEQATALFADAPLAGQAAAAGRLVGFLLLAAAANARPPPSDLNDGRYGEAMGRVMPLAAVVAVILSSLIIRSREADRDAAWAVAAMIVLVGGVLRQFMNEHEHELLARVARKAEARYRDIVHSAQLGILRTAPDGRVLFVNDSFARIIGFASADDLMASGVSAPSFYADQRQRQDVLELLQSSGRVDDFPMEFRRRDGTTGWVHGNMRIVHAPDGRIDYLEAFMTEVTKEHQLAQDLRRSQRTLRVISLCGQALIRAQDEARLTAEVCDLLVRHGGYRMAWIGVAEASLGKPVRAVASAGHEAGYLSVIQASWDEDDPHGHGPVGRAIRERRTQVAQDIQRDARMEPWRQQALQRGYAASCSIPLDLGGERGALMVYAAERSAFGADEVALLEELAANLAFGVKTLRERAQKGQAERERDAAYARYSSIVNNAPEGIVRSSPEGRLVFANQAAATLFGYGSPEQMMAETPSVVALYADATQRPEMLEHFRRGDRTPYELEMVRRDRSRFWAAIRATFVHESDGSVQVQALIEDLTERRRASAEHARMKAELDRSHDQEREVQRLQELNRMRMDFINTAAHDLKTPLTPLKLQMATLRLGGTATPKQQQQLDLMDRSVHRFQALIEDMLDAARLQAGKLQLKRKPVDLATAVQEAVAAFQETGRQAGVQVEVRTQPGVLVDADPTKIMQVLMNLVSNAIKYTPKGGRIRVHAAATSESEASVSVADTGLGLSPEQIARLFQPFVRLHEDVPDAAKGTGLGLYISKGIVEQHGGQLMAESDGPGHGSTFSVVWPLAARVPPPAASGAAGQDQRDRPA